jgi:HSP20 family protein
MRGRDWQALRELLALRAHFQQLFEQALMPSSSLALSADAAYEPATDVWEDASHVVVEMELPGVRADDLEVHLEGNHVVISGSMASPDERTATFLRIERPRGRFARRLVLPCPVKDSTTAMLDGGVLTVVLLKATGGRRISIDSEGERP